MVQLALLEQTQAKVFDTFAVRTVQKNKGDLLRKLLGMKPGWNGAYCLPLGVLAIALGHSSPVQAKELAISFELASDPPSSASSSGASPSEAPSITATSGDDPLGQVQPLQVPDQAEQVPPGRADQVATLPPPPPTLKATVATSGVVPTQVPTREAIAPVASAQPSPHNEVLQFGLAQAQPISFQPAPVQPAAIDEPDVSLDPTTGDTAVDPLFEGGSDSLVARAVGSAEGTRTPAGDRTPAYFGHRDPGNGVWNLGSFSYQHGAKSPDDADRKQLRRLQQQARVLQTKAIALGLNLSLEEQLNGIDLANQAPRAALDRGGYIDWLYQAQQMGLQGADAVLWARTRSFLDPDTQRWNAPGLGNTLQTISHDQERRQQAIASAIVAYQQSAPARSVAALPSQDDAIAHPPQQEKGHINQAESFAENLNSEIGAIAQLMNLDL